MTPLRRVRHLLHLVVRFVGSLVPRPVRTEDAAWVRRHLQPSEFALWETMPRADQVESIGVARRAVHAGVGEVAVAAALVHDVGKQQSGLATIGRAWVAGVDFLAPGWWQRRSGRCAAAATAYLEHAPRGADALRGAGARPELVAWTAAHHDPTLWPGTGLSLSECEVLARADGET